VRQAHAIIVINNSLLELDLNVISDELSIASSVPVARAPDTDGINVVEGERGCTRTTAGCRSTATRSDPTPTKPATPTTASIAATTEAITTPAEATTKIATGTATEATTLTAATTTATATATSIRGETSGEHVSRKVPMWGDGG
jgi:hypothetical protein